MQGKPIGADVDPATLRNDEDTPDQWSLLREVLDVNPEIRTKDELVRELTVPPLSGSNAITSSKRPDG